MRNLIISLLLFFATTLTAQQRFATYNLTAEELVTREIKLFADNTGKLVADIGSYAGNTRVIFNEGETAKIIYREQKSDDKNFLKARNFERIATVNHNEIFYDGYYSKKKSAVYFTELNTISGVAKVTDTLNLTPSEYIADVILDNGTIYILSYLKNTDVILLHAKPLGRKLISVERTITAEIPFASKKATPVFSDFFKKGLSSGYLVYDNSHPNDIQLSALQCKIYHLPGKLVFTLEKPDYQTNLITLSLPDFNASYDSISCPVKFGHRYLKLGNSVLNKNVLVKSSNYGDSLVVTATDVYTKKVYFNCFIDASNVDSIYKNPFFNNSGYDSMPAKTKKKLASYLKFSSVQMNCHENLFNIGLSSYYEGMNGLDVFLSLATTFAGTYMINSVPDNAGVSVVTFSHKGEITINNSFDVNTGKVVYNNSAKIAINEWEQRLKEANDFVKDFAYREDRPEVVISGKKIFVCLVEPSQGKLFIYNF